MLDEGKVDGGRLLGGGMRAQLWHSTWGEGWGEAMHGGRGVR